MRRGDHFTKKSRSLTLTKLAIQLFRSPWLSWIALRHVRSKKDSRFLSFITVLSIVGVSLGVAAMLIVLSVMEGFENQLKRRLMSSDVHLMIETPEMRTDREVAEASPVFQKLKLNPEVELVSPVLSTEVVLKYKSAITGLMIKGIEPPRMELLGKQMVESVATQFLNERDGADVVPLSKIYLGRELTYEMGISPGDIVTVISPAVMDGPGGAIPRVKRFILAGIYSSGLPEQEIHTAFAETQAVSSLLREKGKVSYWEVTLKHFDGAHRLRDDLRPLDRGLQIKSWADLNEHLFYSLKLERVAMFVVLAFIIIVASFNIVTTLTLMVLKKRKEISILVAMGARPDQIGGIFLGEGLLIGGGGVIGGLSVGGALCWVLSRYPIIELPEVYYDRQLPISFEPGYYALVAVAAFLIVLAACIYPALRAARVQPMEGIRS